MDEEGDTPLHSVEDVLSAKYIVEELKADYKIKNRDGQTVSETRSNRCTASTDISHWKSLRKRTSFLK
jgi:hypothetical protein